MHRYYLLHQFIVTCQDLATAMISAFTVLLAVCTCCYYMYKLISD